MLRLSVMGDHVFTHRGKTGDYDHNFYGWLKRQVGCNRSLTDWSVVCEHLEAV